MGFNKNTILKSIEDCFNNISESAICLNDGKNTDKCREDIILNVMNGIHELRSLESELHEIKESILQLMY